MLLANIPLFDQLVHGLTVVLTALHGVIPNYGWALIALALIVRLVMWPLSEIQFRSMAEMQKVQPLVKQLQAKFKNDPQAQNAAMMALYKEHKVNPLAGCVPMLVQFPILIGLYWAIQGQIQLPKSVFGQEHWLWIGSELSKQFPHVFATSLALVTTDGGNTWSADSTGLAQASTSRLEAGYALDATHVWVGGEGSTVLAYTPH